MSNLQIIEAQYEIIEAQNRIIKAQAVALSQLRAAVMEEERAEVEARYKHLLGANEVPDHLDQEGGES